MKQLLTITGILFIILKIVGVIDWPWWLVTMPFWIGYASILLAFSVSFIAVLTNIVIKNYLTKKAIKRNF